MTLNLWNCLMDSKDATLSKWHWRHSSIRGRFDGPLCRHLYLSTPEGAAAPPPLPPWHLPHCLRDTFTTAPKVTPPPRLSPVVRSAQGAPRVYSAYYISPCALGDHFVQSPVQSKLQVHSTFWLGLCTLRVLRRTSNFRRCSAPCYLLCISLQYILYGV